jgi:hypothetical protein
MENLWNILDVLAIARWEAIFFTLLIGAYTAMGLYKSVFVITFGFTFYWGFKNFAFLSETITEGTLTIYVLSGLAVLGLLSLNYVLKERA